VNSYKSRVVFSITIFVLLSFTTIAANDSAPSQDEAVSTTGDQMTADQPIASSLKIGMAKVDMTLDPAKKTLHLTGYGGRRKKAATGVLDPVFARALVASDSEGHMLSIVGLDLCYVNSEIRDRVVEKLSAHGFDENNLLLAATHTHSSLGGYDRTFIAKTLFGDLDQDVLDHIVSSIVSAVLKAKENMVPARIEIATENIKGMNRSRRDPAFEFSEKDEDRAVKPNPEKYPVDERLTVFRIARVDGKPIGAVIHFTAHPTILSPKNLSISADYPGVLYRRVEESMGEGAVAIFLNGTEGDTAPTPDWERDLNKEIANVKEYGNKLADEVLRVLPKVSPMPKTDIAYKTVYSELPGFIIRPLFHMHLSARMTRLFYLRSDAPFQAVRLGDIIMIALPGEPTTNVGRSLGSLCPTGYSCMIVAPANGYLAYFVTPEQYKEGGYEANSNFLGPDVIDWLKSSVSQVLPGVQ